MEVTTEPGKVVKVPASLVTTPARPSCYNCGRTGHLGHECTRRRMDARLVPFVPYVAQYAEPSASKQPGLKKKRALSSFGRWVLSGWMGIKRCGDPESALEEEPMPVGEKKKRGKKTKTEDRAKSPEELVFFGGKVKSKKALKRARKKNLRKVNPEDRPKLMKKYKIKKFWPGNY